MKKLFENWKKFLNESLQSSLINEEQSLVNNVSEVSWEEVKRHLNLYLGPSDYAFVVPKEAETNEVKWVKGLVSPKFVGRKKPWNVEIAREYASSIKKDGIERLPPIVVILEWQGEDTGYWKPDVLDGEHRSYAANLAGVDSIPAYVGYPSWAKLEDLVAGNIYLE